MLNLLIAYPYLNPDTAYLLKKNEKDIRLLIDSGAFTAWKAGSSIDLDKYCSFLEKLNIKAWNYFSLDVIGDPEKSYNNYIKMKKRGLNPIPIFTRGDDISMINTYYETSDLIGVGGLVGTPGNRGFVKAIMKEINGRKVHWLGFTNKNFIKNYMPYSCDSSSVTMAGRFGQFELFNEHDGSWVKCGKKDFAKIPSRKIINLLKSYKMNPLALKNKRNWHGVSNSELVSFSSHIRASLTYEKKINTKYFLALSRVPYDVKISLNMYKKEITLCKP